MKINTRILLTLILIGLIPLVVISITFGQNARQSLTDEVLSHLQSVAAIQRHRVESIVEQNLERLTLVSSRTQLRLSLDSFLMSPNAQDQAKMNTILADALSSVSGFQDISVLNLDGEVVASTNEASIGSIPFNEELVTRGQRENSADTLFLDGNHNLSVYLSGPLYLEDRLLGIVVIDSTADNIVSAVEDYTGLGATGETLLARKDESGDALFLTPTRFDEHADLSRIVSQKDSDSPTIQALAGNVKLFTDAVDYRGEPVLAATQYISKTGWGLVTKIDRAEALAPVSNLQYWSLTAICLSIVLILAVSLFLARVITRPITRLAQVATRVSEGDLSLRAEVKSKDEIGALAQACNQMKDNLLKTNSQLQQELAERKQAEEKYSTLVEQGNDGIIIIQDGMVKFANSKMIEMTGFTLEEAMSSSFVDFVAPEYKAPVIENYQRRLSGEDVANKYEIEIVAKDGSRIAVEINASRIEYQDKPADMAIVRDITERKGAESALRQSEERYRDLFDNTNDLIQSVSPDGRLLYVNQAWKNVLGYTNEEIADLKMWDIIHPSSLNHCMETFKRVMLGESISDIEAVFLAKDGSSVAVEGNAHCRFVNGLAISTQGIFRDVTSRKMAEEKIIHLNSLLRALRDVNQLITRESDREHLVQQSCDILVSTRGYEKAWVLLVDENKKPQYVAAAGPGDELPEFIEQMKSGHYPECVKQLWTRKNQFLSYKNPGSRHRDCILADRHKSRGVYRYRLEYEGKVYGIIGVTIPSHVIADEEEKGLFLELCGDISFALATIDMERERRRVEQELRDSEARLAEAQHIAHIGSWELDLVSNKLIWSDEVYRIFDLEPQQFEATYEAFLDNIYPDDREMVNKAYTESVSNKAPYNITHRLLLKDGTLKYVSESCQTFYEDGKAIRSLGTVQDITQRKLADEKIRESESKYRTLVENIPQKIFLKDRNLFYVSCNENFARDLKIQAGEIDGKTDYDFFPKELADKYRVDDQRVIESGKTEEIEEEYIQDGRKLVVQTLKTPVRDESGNITGVLGVFWDITERKKAEEEIRKFSDAVGGAADGIGMTDMKGTITYVNSAMEEMYGYNKGEMLGMPVMSLGANPDMANKIMSSMMETGSWNGEIEAVKKNKSTFPVLLSLSTTRDRKGDPIAMMGVSRDLTERKKMEEQLVLTDRLASVGELASGIAHELNNPLTGVIGLSQLLVEKDIPGDIKEDLKLVYSEAQRAASVVKNLLTFARKHPPTKELLNINDVIKKVLEIRAYEERVTNIKVVTRLSPDLPQIMADYFQLQQVFLNIVINAEHFMSEEHNRGTLTITTRNTGSTVRASFADDGPGILKENLGHIFDPFFTTKEVGKGTGLGLSICHGIISAHNGRIYAESKPGKGATFIVELPVSQEEQQNEGL